VDAALTALDTILSPFWTRRTPWIVTGCLATALAHEVTSGDRVSLAAVLCAADGMATASLAREIGVLKFLAHQPSVLPLLGSGRAAGCLYAVTPCTDGISLGEQLTREGPLPADEVLTQVIAAAVELLVDPRWDALRTELGFATFVGHARAQWTVS